MVTKGTSRATSRASDRAGVERYPDEANSRFLVIRCEECEAQVDRVEYDAAEGDNPHVTQLMSLLGCDEKKAGQILSDQNPDLLLSQEERARDLADQIVDRSVPDRPKSTYACPNGHNGGLKVTE